MRILAIFTGAFSAGVILAQEFLPESWQAWFALAAFCAACLRLWLPGAWGRRLLLAGTGLAIGIGWNCLYVRQIQPFQTLSGTELSAEMILCDYAAAAPYGARADVRIDGLGRLVYYGGAELLALEPGQIIQDKIRLQYSGHLREDDITAFTSRGVFLLAYGRGKAVYSRGNAGDIQWFPVWAGHALQEKIAQLMHGDEAAFVSAMLTGDRSGLSEQASADLSETGLSHILAVSGMHCGFFIAFLRLLLGKQRRFLTAACGIPLLVFYAALTGGRPSVIRACIMLAFLTAAPLFHRTGDAPTSLSAALFLLLVQNPYAEASVSLRLSFASVAGLLWLAPKIYAFLIRSNPENRIVRYLSAWLAASAGAWIFTAPLSAWYFGLVPLVSPLSNLLCLWAAGGIFTLGLTAVITGFLLPSTGTVLAVLPALLIRYVLTVIHMLAKLPFHAVYFSNPYLKYWLVFMYLLIGVLCLARKPAARSVLLAVFLSAVTLIFVEYRGRMVYHNAIDAVVLDVGQGQSVIVSSGGRYALIDCGSANSWYDPGSIAAGQLRSMGCQRLDALILTHYDSDHVNGVEALLARLDAGILLVPESEDDSGLQKQIFECAQEHNVMIQILREQEIFLFGNGLLTVFPPLGTAADGDNERGLSVLASVGETDLLITGDMGQKTERKLLAAYDLQDIESIVAGHHGSRYSTSDLLLSRLQPETVCISVGSNSYGHPAEDTLERLETHGCTVYRTDQNGSIHLALE